MIGTMFLFLNSPLGRYLAIGLAVMVVVGGLAWKIYAQGKAAGKKAEKISELEESNEKMNREFSELGNLVKDQRAKLDKMDDELRLARVERERYRQESDRWASVVNSISAQRQVIHQQVDRMSDSEVAPAIKQALGLRAPEDYGRPGFLPEEEKDLLRCVLDRPKCQEQNQALTKRIENLEGEMGSLDGQVSTLEGKVTSLETISAAQGTFIVDVMFPAYDDAVKAIGLKRCNWFTLCVLKKDKKLLVPTLEELQVLQPKPGGNS